MNTAKTIFKNFFSLAGSQVISQALGFAVIVYLARTLGAEGFGKLGFAQAIIVCFGLFINLGLDTFGTREVARNQKQIQRYMNNILAIKLIASISAFLCLTIFVFLIPKLPNIKKLILFYGFTFFTSAFLIEWLFQGIESMEFIAISRIIKQIAYVGLIFMIVRSPDQILRIPLVNLGASIIATTFLLSIYLRNFKNIKLDFDFFFWKEILKKSLPMGFSFIMIQVYYHSDFVILGFMKGETVVGFYNAAYKIVFLIIGFGSLFGNAIFPTISRYYKESTEKLQKLLFYSSKLTLFVAIPIAVGGTILARPMIILLYGNQYLDSIIAFQILVWSIFTVFANIPFAFSLLGCDQQKQYMQSVTIGAILNICLNLYLIPKYSLVGAAIATISAELAVLSLLYFHSQQITKVVIKVHILKFFLSAILMGFVLHSLNLNLYILIPLGMLIYILVCLFLKTVTIEELIFVNNLLRRDYTLQGNQLV